MTGGFQNTEAKTLNNSTSFCHDDHGNISALFSVAPDEDTYITLMGSKQRSSHRCDSMNQRIAMRQDGEFTSAMPNLSLPEDVISSQSLGMSSSGDGATTRIQLETSLTSSELLEFFGDQLATQSWSEETQWTGRRISGSVWISNDDNFFGLLRIVEQGSYEYKLDFEIIGDR